MKKIVVYLLIAALIALPGCRRAEPGTTETTMPLVGTAQNILLTEPPALTVRCGDGEATVGSGNYTWSCENEAGRMQEVIACGADPSSLWEEEPTLITAAEEAELTWAVMPDSVTVRCWSTAGSTETWDVEFQAEITGNVLTLNPGRQIYEITAAWDSSEVYSGKASYAVCILHQE